MADPFDELPVASGYYIMIDTLSEGWVPSVYDGNGAPYLFGTRREAELEIADTIIERLNEFIRGEREFDDATTLEEFVVDVSVLADGSTSSEYW